MIAENGKNQEGVRQTKRGVKRRRRRRVVTAEITQANANYDANQKRRHSGWFRRLREAMMVTATPITPRAILETSGVMKYEAK